MKNKIIILLMLVLVASTLTLAAKSETEYSFNLFEPPTFDNDTAFVNQSRFWNTLDRGPLDRVDSIFYNWLTPSDLPIGSNLITNIGAMYMNTTPVLQTVEEGLMQWNENDGTLNIGLGGGNVNLQVGQEQVTRVRNNLGSQIDDGKVVYINGAQGEIPTINLSDTMNSDTINVLGVTTESISDGSNGYVTMQGLVRDIDTTGTPVGQSWSEGDRLYLNSEGNMSNVHPSAPNAATIVIGIVVKASEEDGIILVNPESFTLGNNFNGTLRSTIINKNESGAVGFTAVNDLGYFTTMGIASSQNALFPNSVSVYYAPGYGEHWTAIDGAEDYVWFSDPTDSHDNSALNNEIMRLTYTGNLSIQSNLSLNDTIFFQDEDHFMKLGTKQPFNGISSESFWFHHEEDHPEGEILFTFTQLNKTILAGQVGRNNSAGILGNSWMVIPNNLTTNYTEFSDCFIVADSLNKTLRVACDTSETGADFIVQDDIQTFGTMFADEGIRAETLADFVMNGNDFQIQNGSLHILTPVDFTSGVNTTDPVVKFSELFLGGLGQFSNLQVDVGNWFATSDVLCDDGDCANALGISGVGSIQMEANTSTTNINNSRLNFVYSLANMLGADSFSVIVENSTTSTTVFTDSTTNVALSQQSIDISEFDNQTDISIVFDCDVTQTNRQCFVDTISVNGTAIESTLTNQSGFDSQICFSDGVKDSEGICNVGVYFNASANTVFPQGNWNLSGAGGGGTTDHSALTNLEWASAGHTFSSGGQTMDVGSYDFTTTGDISAAQADFDYSDSFYHVTLADSNYAGVFDDGPEASSLYVMDNNNFLLLSDNNGLFSIGYDGTITTSGGFFGPFIALDPSYEGYTVELNGYFSGAEAGYFEAPSGDFVTILDDTNNYGLYVDTAISGNTAIYANGDAEVVGNLLFNGATSSGTHNGGVFWSGGSQLREQTAAVGGTNRMTYLPNGDRFEVLNEAGSAFIAGFHGANSGKPSSFRSYEGVTIGGTVSQSNDVIVDGLIVDGDVEFRSGLNITEHMNLTSINPYGGNLSLFNTEDLGGSTDGYRLKIHNEGEGSHNTGEMYVDKFGQFIIESPNDVLKLQGGEGVRFEEITVSDFNIFTGSFWMQLTANADSSGNPQSDQGRMSFFLNNETEVRFEHDPADDNPNIANFSHLDIETTGNINIGGNLTTPNGGKLWDNSTCTFLSSPDGSTVLEVCNA